MTDKELIGVTVSRYMDLLRIQAAANPAIEIANQLRELRVQLSSFGINVEELKIDTP